MEDDDKDLEWTEQERAELAALLRQPAPPAELERRVVGRLVMADLVTRRRALVARRSWLLAAGLALLLVGFGLGRWQVPSANAGPMNRYLLLLHEDESFRPDRAQAEVGRWAMRLQRAGELIEGDKLGLHGHLLMPGGAETGLAPGDVIAGVFMLRAASDERALTIARTCPHLAHGGRAELRRIEPDGEIRPLR